MYKLIGKRIFDVLFVLIVFLFLTPLFVFISILIKAFDPGPIFFKQERFGVKGRKFVFYKFRSMPVNTGNHCSAQLGEIKLTWVGRFIRRTSIDELPQLLNIIKGDMSLVGPRPPINSQTELMGLRESNGSIEVRPGLTGLAQINSFDGMTIIEKAKFDGIYAEKITFLQDLKIILNTFTYLLKPPPVY